MSALLVSCLVRFATTLQQLVPLASHPINNLYGLTLAAFYPVNAIMVSMLTPLMVPVIVVCLSVVNAHR